MRNAFQTGFAAVAALFLVVVLAALGAFMWHMGMTQQLTSAQDVQGSCAYWAARGGLEWGLTRINAVAACPAPSLSLTISGFSVTVFCTVAAYSEANRTVSIFQLRSVASTGTLGTISYVERSVSASLER